MDMVQDDSRKDGHRADHKGSGKRMCFGFTLEIMKRQ